jgi:hypothetical protein
MSITPIGFGRSMPGRRCWLVGLLSPWVACAWASTGNAADPTVEVWIELTEPVPATAGDAVEAARRRDRVALQQRNVARELQRLGAVEVARVRHARNAIAVRLPRSRLDAARAVPGVQRVRPVSELHPPKPMEPQ